MQNFPLQFLSTCNRNRVVVRPNLLDSLCIIPCTIQMLACMALTRLRISTKLVRKKRNLRYLHFREFATRRRIWSFSLVQLLRQPFSMTQTTDINSKFPRNQDHCNGSSGTVSGKCKPEEILYSQTSIYVRHGC